MWIQSSSRSKAVYPNIYILLSCYSLIKLPRGSNVSGGDILKTLIDIKTTDEEDIKKKVDLEMELDNLLDDGKFEALSDQLCCTNENENNIIKVHSHILLTTLHEMQKTKIIGTLFFR